MVQYGGEQHGGVKYGRVQHGGVQDLNRLRIRVNRRWPRLGFVQPNWFAQDGAHHREKVDNMERKAVQVLEFCNHIVRQQAQTIAIKVPHFRGCWPTSSFG